MPFPYSQTMDTIDVAYFFDRFQWPIRLIITGILLWCLYGFIQSKSWKIPSLIFSLAILFSLLIHYKMSAEKLFLQVETLNYFTKNNSPLSEDRLVLGINHKGISKAYPIEQLAYHHQIMDTFGMEQVLITYCSVCRSGRAFSPMIDTNKNTKFRLVGMDHFNAMFEDNITKSWWRQATGEAIAGPKKGSKLSEIFSQQMSLSKWWSLYPNGKVMSPDPMFFNNYDSSARFEKGTNKSSLTGRDTMSWKNKSWIVGIQLGNETKAYDWKELSRKKLINDYINNIPIVIFISEDKNSFASFIRNDTTEMRLYQDQLYVGSNIYNFNGISISNPANKLIPIPAYQEFWQSWKTFHPKTSIYRSKF